MKKWLVVTNNKSFQAPELAPCLRGYVYGHPNHVDGKLVHTSKIIKVIENENCKEVYTYRIGVQIV